MVRVVGLLLAGILVTGCSLGTHSLSLGLNGGSNPFTTASTSGGGIESRPATRKQKRSEQRTASLDQKPSSKNYRKAPPGALADRDYSHTKLVAEEARRMINAYRRQHGLKPLTLNVLLTKAAKAHSRDLAQWDRISHYGSDGSNPWDRVRRAGYRARLTAENVGTGQASLAEVFEGWKNSPGHNKNLLLKDAKNMGIALVRAPKTEFKTFWTLVVGAPL